MEKFDLFGKSISANFRGEEKYKTKVGGLLSILLATFILASGSLKFYNLVERNDHTD
jgi:hypothetical protein